MTTPPLITATAGACQAACLEEPRCGAFQWIEPSTATTDAARAGMQHNQCIFKCVGAVAPIGRGECRIGMKTFFGVCGPKVNNSNAPLPPPAPPTPPPLPPLLQCPVPFGSSGGQLEDGTDHTRAPGQAGSGLAGSEIVTALTCNPWCLFNLTDDIGERNDLGANPQ